MDESILMKFTFAITTESRRFSRKYQRSRQCGCGTMYDGTSKLMAQVSWNCAIPRASWHFAGTVVERGGEGVVQVNNNSADNRLARQCHCQVNKFQPSFYNKRVQTLMVPAIQRLTSNFTVCWKTRNFNIDVKHRLKFNII